MLDAMRDAAGDIQAAGAETELQEVAVDMGELGELTRELDGKQAIAKEAFDLAQMKAEEAANDMAAVQEANTAFEAKQAEAAGLGVELFVLDAGWYLGTGVIDQWDFTSGLGSWIVDPEKFPSGLRAMSDRAHSYGLKFGLWFEPERVARSLVGEPDMPQEEWLATQDGNYGDERSAQLCLASDDARQWVFNRIVQVLDEVMNEPGRW